MGTGGDGMTRSGGDEDDGGRSAWIWTCVTIIAVVSGGGLAALMLGFWWMGLI